MKPISDLVRKYGSLRKTGKVLNRCHATVDRWVKAGAKIDGDGAVWIKTAETGFKQGEEE
jgi:IS30 family transposase